MSKFKVGDKVRAISNAGSTGISVGSTYTVQKVRKAVTSKDEDLIEVEGFLAQFASRWELVETPKPARQVLIIVALPEGGYTIKEPTAFGTSEAPLAAFTHLYEATSFIDRNMK